MAKGPSSPDAAPDLFSHAVRQGDAPLPVASQNVAPKLPHLLPKDLPGSLRRLSNQELDRLFSASGEEMRRRKLVTDTAPVPTGMPARGKPQKKKLTSVAAKASKTSGPLPVTPAKLNAIKAALKAGVKPSTVARQFGVTPAMIKKAVEYP